MTSLLRHCCKVARSQPLVRPATPTSPSSVQSSISSRSMNVVTPFSRCYVTSTKPKTKATAMGKIDCACARHPWPEEKIEVTKKKTKDCDFDFRKNEVNPYDIPCDCKDSPPAAGCADVGKPKEVCCRSTRQYGCHCEEEVEESCDEEEAFFEEGPKSCDLDFRKLEVNPYDESCDCTDPPPAASCEDLGKNRDVCCRTPKPFGCMCEAYDEPGLTCLKSKAPRQMREKKECAKKNKFDVKCS